MLVHVLGNCSNLTKIKQLCKSKDIYIIEDSCESLGTKFNNKFVGTFGDFGTYSFYYSHQITSGEGGMVVCNNYNDYKILHELRSHGWDRKYQQKNKVLNQKFNFVNSGFNLRPLDISAAIGMSQFKRLNMMMKVRDRNRKKIIETLKNSKEWDNQFSFLEPGPKVNPSWFGLPILINEKFAKHKNKFLKFLSSNGIETRPIISGNFLNQKSIRLHNLNPKSKMFPGSQYIEDKGFFIGIHTSDISENKLNFLTKKLLFISYIQNV